MWEGLCEVSGEMPCAFAGLRLDDDRLASTGERNVSVARTEENTFQEKREGGQNTFREKLEGSRFVVTGEVAPPHGVDCSAMRESIRRWAPICDAVNITDNQGAALHLSSLAASRMALDEGVESVFQQTCRDRNRLALQSDLLAAHTLGLRNFLAVTGDNARATSAVRRMFDLDSTQLLAVARGLNEGVTLEGTEIGETTDFYLGAAAFLDAEPWDAQLARIAQKIDAGARFFQTQAIMDSEKAPGRIAQIQQLGARVIPGVLLLKNVQVIDFIDARLEGLHVPDHLRRRIADASDPLEAAIALAVEQAQMIAEVADGIHVMPLANDHAGIEVIKRAKIR
jgi:5,10-methylenetetrahydrofolate reductase